jgi:xylulokinase
MNQAMNNYIGLDVGTTGVKALLVNEQGTILSTATVEYPLYTPFPLWSEQEPEDWWQASIKVLHQIVNQAGIKKSDICAIGLTGQMHGSVFLDKHQTVIRRALLWNDQRTAAECQQITEAIGYDKLIEIAGNPALTGFQAPKILWLRNNEPEAYARLDKVLLPKDYIRLMLTGEFATDCSDAAGTLLLDLRNRDWSTEILSRLGIPLEWMPTVFEGSQVTGKLLPDIAEKIGLSAGIPVVAGGGDNAAAAVGTGIVRRGLVSSSIGTSGVIFAHSDEITFDPKGRLHTFCHAVPNKNHLMAVTLSAGNSFRWLRDTFQAVVNDYGVSNQKIDYAGLTALAAKVEPGCEGLVFLPYLTGERAPHLDPFATGAFIGLTSRHSPAHMARAVMEGVVFSLLDGLEIMRNMGVPIEQVRAIGGGGKSELWCQMQADIFGCEVVNLEVEEGPAYGAAILSIAADQDAEGVSQVSESCVHTKTSRTPIGSNVERYQQYYDVYRGLYRTLKDDMHKLTNLATQ